MGKYQGLITPKTLSFEVHEGVAVLRIQEDIGFASQFIFRARDIQALHAEIGVYLTALAKKSSSE